MSAYSYTDHGLIERGNADKFQDGPPKEMHRVQGNPIPGHAAIAFCGLTFIVNYVFTAYGASDECGVKINKCPYCFPERPKAAIAA